MSLPFLQREQEALSEGSDGMWLAVAACVAAANASLPSPQRLQLMTSMTTDTFPIITSSFPLAKLYSSWVHETAPWAGTPGGVRLSLRRLNDAARSTLIGELKKYAALRERSLVIVLRAAGLWDDLRLAAVQAEGEVEEVAASEQLQASPAAAEGRTVEHRPAEEVRTAASEGSGTSASSGRCCSGERGGASGEVAMLAVGGAAEAGAAEAGRIVAGTAEAGAAEGGPAEVRAAEAGAAEIGTAEALLMFGCLRAGTGDGGAGLPGPDHRAPRRRSRKSK